jgi:ABC-type glucose/galactose transport system permease subunit
MSTAALISIVVAVLVLAILLWGGDRLLALWPSQGKLVQAARIIVIVAVSLWLLSLIAGFFGVGLPWSSGIPVEHYRHR